MPQKQDILIALACSIAIFFLAYFIAGGQPALGNPDGANAIHIAKNLAAGDGLVTRIVVDNAPPASRPSVTKPPFFSFLIAALSLLGLDPYKGAGMLVLICTSLSVGLLFLLARQSLPTKWAVTIALLFGVQGKILNWAILIHEEMVLVMLIFSALLMTTILIDREKANSKLPWQAWTTLGMLCGAALLTSYQALPLLITVTLFVIFTTRSNAIKKFSSYTFGLMCIGLYPLIRISLLYNHGIRPSFTHGPESTWLLVSSSIIHSLQVVFFGKMAVWLNEPDIFHYTALYLSYSALIATLIITGLNYRSLLPSIVFVGIYLTMLLIRSANEGIVNFEPRFLVPVIGIIFLILGCFSYIIYQSKLKYVRIGIMAFVFLFIGTYLYGQFKILKNLTVYRRDLGVSGDYCHAPKTIKWVKDNLPDFSTIISSQCGFQLIAEVNKMYWLPIPPADEYPSSSKYNQRWTENDFLRVNNLTGAKWIVLLRGDKGDPLQQTPGYGLFIEEMFRGKIKSDVIKLVSDLGDGVVYSIERNKLPTLN